MDECEPLIGGGRSCDVATEVRAGVFGFAAVAAVAAPAAAPATARGGSDSGGGGENCSG